MLFFRRDGFVLELRSPARWLVFPLEGRSLISPSKLQPAAL
jgi:hypothetical protein